MTEVRNSNWRLILAFATVYLVWGSTYLGIRLAIGSIPPLLMAGARFLAAGAVLFGLRWFQIRERPQLRHWRTATILGFLLLLCGNGGVTLAEQRVASGMAALLVTSEPLWIVVLNWLRPRGTAPTPREIIGVVVGFGGVVLLLAPQLQSASNGPLLWGSLTILGSALAWAAGSLFGIRAQTVADRPMGNGMTMLAGGALMLAVGLAGGERVAPQQISMTSLLAWAYLTVFGSLAAFSAYTFLMRNTTPAKASTYAFVNPVVAVLLGWGFAGEPIDARSIAAIVIIAGAVMLLTLNPAPAAALPSASTLPLDPHSTRSAMPLTTQLAASPAPAPAALERP
jgi:drug/metabolite transporter (DMT)-like permease